MSTSPTSLILGFHGCDEEIGERVLRGEIKHLAKSQNVYDWLGHGIYFWEHNPARALEFARELAQTPRKRRPKISTPFVIGAIISPGNCLNLLESGALQELKATHANLIDTVALSGTELPKNRQGKGGEELMLRDLDCAVVEALHETMRTDGRPPYDTVRGLFPEGEPLYPNAGFREKDHIQICVRDSAQILGYFRPLN